MTTDIRSRTGDPSPTPPPPRWAVVCAWLAALTPLPSAIWRPTAILEKDDMLQGILDGDWYLILLSVLSLVFSFLAVGLVRPWSLVYPRWIPFLGGKPVSATRATAAAYTGAILVMLVFGYGLWNQYIGHLQPFKPLINGGTIYPQPGNDIMSLYIPLFFWGPLLIAVAANYHRRRKAAR